MGIFQCHVSFQGCNTTFKRHEPKKSMASLLIQLNQTPLRWPNNEVIHVENVTQDSVEKGKRENIHGVLFQSHLDILDSFPKLEALYSLYP